MKIIEENRVKGLLSSCVYASTRLCVCFEMEALSSLCANPKLISSCLKDWNKFGRTNL